MVSDIMKTIEQKMKTSASMFQADLATVLMYFMDVFDPEAEMDFSEAGMLNGWNVYTFSQTVYTGDSNRLWLAGGFTARWETELRKYMDDFTIKITPLSE